MTRFAIPLLLALMAGCAAAPATPRETYALVEGDFTALVEAADAARAAGQLTGDAAARVASLITAVDAGLHAARALLDQGKTSDVLSLLTVVSNQLLAVRQAVSTNG